MSCLPWKCINPLNSSETTFSDKYAQMGDASNHLTICMLGNFACSFVKCGFKIKFFKKMLQEYHQSVKQFGSRSGPTQTVCKGYQQMTKVVTSGERVNETLPALPILRAHLLDLFKCLQQTLVMWPVTGRCLVNPSLAEHDMPCLSKHCRSRSVGFFRSQLIWICTVCH